MGEVILSRTGWNGRGRGEERVWEADTGKRWKMIEEVWKGARGRQLGLSPRRSLQETV